VAVVSAAAEELAEADGGVAATQAQGDDATQMIGPHAPSSLQQLREGESPG
jgi:hypothetical protein